MKKKIFAIALAASIAVLAIAGTSMAYFTDTEQYTNVFTAGNVEIQMTEAVVIDDGVGNLIKDSNATNRIVINDAAAQKDYGKLFPSQTIYKDPKIENIGSENAFVGAIITIRNNPYVSGVNISSVVTPEMIDGFIQKLSKDATITYASLENGGYQIYMIFNKAIAKDESYTLFEGIKVPAAWDNTEMANCQNLNIVVNAYATQTAGFADATTALTTAFATKGWNAADLNATTTLPRNP